MREILVLVPSLLILLFPKLTRRMTDYLLVALLSITRKKKIIRPNPECECCNGDCAYLNGSGLVMPCVFGCGEPKPQKVVNYLFRSHVENLGLRIGLDEKSAQQFAKDVCDLADARIGPPIPAFVRGEKGWEYKPEGPRSAIPLR